MAAAVSWIAEKDKCKEFLALFKRKDGSLKYMELLQSVSNRTLKLVNVELDDVYEFKEDLAFLNNIENNAFHYRELFASSIEENMPPPSIQLTVDQTGLSDADVMNMERIEQHEARQREGGNDLPGAADGGDFPAAASEQNIPKKLLRRFEVQIIPRTKHKMSRLREISSDHIGKLVRVRGVVTHATSIQPLLTYATYMCARCGVEDYQEVTTREYMPINECASEKCKVNRTARNSRLHLHVRGSRFERFQMIQLQENSSEVPVGHVPRHVSIHVRGELAGEAGLGDAVTVDGIFLPVRNSGFRAMRFGLLTDTYISACHITKDVHRYEDLAIEKENLIELKGDMTDEQFYDNLAYSIAPEIFGLEDQKKALLLLMVGGVSRSLSDGVKIRGDINVLLVGDPGVAKSQLLKYISNVAPRCVYTTGKGSSGVGLTAAVLRDPITKDFVLEGGALVMADKGICCIDEFDKMDDTDRTSIYEVMEQQTVSIAKGGITTTLNARTAVLAAANPKYGRWNSRMSIAANVDLAAALLSRFDLLFVIMDEPDTDGDTELGRHITQVHMNEAAPATEGMKQWSASQMRSFIAAARRHDPFIPPRLRERIVGNYVALRETEKKQIEKQRDKHIQELYNDTCVTPRSLLTILRLCQGLARLRFAEEVNESDVAEAERIMTSARLSAQSEDIQFQGERREDPVTAVFQRITDMFHARQTNQLRLADVQNSVLQAGIRQEQFQQAIDTYQEMNVWMVSNDETSLTLVSANE